MLKKMFKFVLVLTFMTMMFSLIACTQSENVIIDEQKQSLQQMDYNVASDRFFDSDGQLLVPFDVAYSAAFLNGEVLFDDDVILVKLDKTFDINQYDELLAIGVDQITPMMTDELTTWYKLSLNHVKAQNVMSRVRSLDNVLVADYDYIYDDQSIGQPIISDESSFVENPLYENQWYLNAYGIEDAWVWMDEQGYSAGGLSSVVVAVIDTGVDYNHLDLKNNMWINPNEIPYNGIDDDNNGFVDDIYGADTVGNNGNPMDDHGHGTHVAGIIAASNNKEGIVGVAYNTKIMAVKAGQASGYFNQSDIAEAVNYAYQNGADVINMSFGGSAISIAVQDALMNAYTTSVLVAAAGNSGLPNERVPGWFGCVIPNYPAALSYVIGVMSVNPQGVESVFTNWDGFAFNQIEYEVYAPGEEILSTLPNNQYASWSGTSMATPVVSGVAALLRSVYTDRNTYPNKFIMGQINATSEISAIPLPYLPVHNVPQIIDPLSALSKLPKPDVRLYNYYLIDDETRYQNNNGDGVVDAGETIDLGVVLRNRWGMSKNTLVKIDSISTGGVENPYIEFLVDSANFEGVGTYSTKDTLIREGEVVVGTNNPLTFKVAEDTPNDYTVRIYFTLSFENGLDENDSTLYQTGLKRDMFIEFTVRSGVVLPSVISEDMTLTNENYYIIPNGMIILEGATLYVEEGVNIQFWSDDPEDFYAQTTIAYLRVEGNLIVEGSAENPVKIFPSELFSKYNVTINQVNNGYVSLRYSEVTNGQLNIGYADHSKFTVNYLGYYKYRYLDAGMVRESQTNVSIRIDQAENSIFYGFGGETWDIDYGYTRPYFYGSFYNNIFVNSSIRFDAEQSYFENNVFLGNNASVYGSYLPSSVRLNKIGNFEEITVLGTNESTGVTYIAIRPEYSYYESTLDNLKRFVDYLGGSFLKFETVEEYEYFKNINHPGNFNLQISKNMNGDLVWFDGELIPNFFIKGDLSKINYYIDASYRIYSENYRQTTYVIEVEGDTYVDLISLMSSEVILDLEGSYQIGAHVSPVSYDQSLLQYHSSDETVVTVDEMGLITPVSKGEATVYVYSGDYLTSSKLLVKVIDKVSLENFDLSLSTKQLAIGESYQLNIEYTPMNTTEKQLVYTSEDELIATVTGSGLVTAKNEGSVIIHVENTDGTLSDTIEITVVNPVTSITFNESFYTTDLVSSDESFGINIYPVNATNKNILWESSNPEVAYVNEFDELVKLQEGLAVIKATVENTSLSAEVVVSIKDVVTQGSVKKLLSYDNNIYALYSDNHIYFWGEDSLVPKPLDIPYEGEILDVSIFYGLLVILTDTHTLKTFYISSFVRNGEAAWETNDYGLSELSGIMSIEGSDNNLHALDSYGSVWTLGHNYYGQLGDGTTTDRYTPVQASINNVKKIVATYYSTYYLTTNNEVYVAGTSENTYLTPLLLHTNVSKVFKTGLMPWNGRVIVVSSQGNFAYNADGYNNSITFGSNEILVDNSTYKIENNKLYAMGYNRYGQLGNGIISNNWTYEYSEVLLIDNPVSVYQYQSYTILVLTSDGKLYIFGQNNNNVIVGETGSTPIPVEVIFGISGNYESLTFTDNLDNGVLYNDQLTFDFNESLMNGMQFGYITLKNESGQSLGISKEISLDRFVIYPVGGWVVGETYTLTLPSSALSTLFSLESESTIIEFTYLGIQTPIQMLDNSLDADDTFDQKGIDITLDFSFASESINFNNMTIVNEFGEDWTNSVSITLVDNTLLIEGVLPAGQYTLTIPQDALKDNLGGYNEEILDSFGVNEVLVIESQSHENGDLRKAIDEPIVIIFSTSSASDAFDQIKLFDEQDQEVLSTVTFENSVLTITPNQLLTEGTIYKVYVPENAVIDDSANANELIELSFKTYAPFAYERTSITDGASHVALDQTIAIYFNYATNGDNYTDIALRDESGNLVNTNKTLKDQVLNITPSEDLAENTTYVLTIPANSLVDEQGNANEEMILSFTTIEQFDRFTWTKLGVLALAAEYKATGYYSSFIGNAILNNLNDTDISHWLRISGSESSSYEDSAGISGNYWGTIDEEMIERQILDFDDYQTLVDLILGDYLLEAPSNVWPFVANVDVLNELGEVVQTVGNDLITVRVSFNRDMDPSIPLIVNFGSSLPYGEYQIDGAYIDARTWEGTYQLTTIIENGNQYFSIQNGAAADDAYLTLQPDYARFTFEIDTTIAQALIMQAHATTEGIELTWEQDDFDTLAGYNVYRSYDEYGYYQRLNTSVIPADVKSFFDSTVEPGVVYYYNFTVVQTDLTESEPSGKVVIQSYDHMAPNIYHTPVYQAFTNRNVIISATIVDNLSVHSAVVYYRMVGSSTWSSVVMNKLNDRFTGIISATVLSVEGLEYYIDAYDGVNHTLKGSAENPYNVIVQIAVDEDEYGDVNGDGQITTLDALMLLQALNNRLNLSAEEFARADLDDDGILEAVEALRILQYVSGQVTTIR